MAKGGPQRPNWGLGPPRARPIAPQTTLCGQMLLEAKHQRRWVWVRRAVSRPPDQPTSPPSALLGHMGWLEAQGLGGGAPSSHRALPRVAFVRAATML